MLAPGCAPSKPPYCQTSTPFLNAEQRSNVTVSGLSKASNPSSEFSQARQPMKQTLLYGVVWVSLIWMYFSEIRTTPVMGKAGQGRLSSAP